MYVLGHKTMVNNIECLILILIFLIVVYFLGRFYRKLSMNLFSHNNFMLIQILILLEMCFSLNLNC